MGIFSNFKCVVFLFCKTHFFQVVVRYLTNTVLILCNYNAHTLYRIIIIYSVKRNDVTR